MDEYFIVLLGIPFAWMFICLSYQMCNLIYLWLKSKMQDIKNKEYSLWD